uniref:Cyclase n=1 Tax=Strigamia maritima TaxID=126957 RepID=T1JNL8_STRMM
MKLIASCVVVCIVLIAVEGVLIDLSHNYNESTQYWPTATQKFELTIQARGFIGDGLWYSSNNFCSSEHSGTHLDAPYHFNEHGWTVEQIPLDHLFQIPAAVVDISERISQNIHPLDLTVEDLAAWELVYGRIPDKGIVIMHSGWIKNYHDSNSYYNSTTLTDMHSFNFPGIDPQAAMWLVNNRNIVAVGVDSASADGKGEAKSHQILLGKNVYILENLANVEQIPAKGAFIYALPMKIEGGSGAPCRVLAKC